MKCLDVVVESCLMKCLNVVVESCLMKCLDVVVERHQTVITDSVMLG